MSIQYSNIANMALNIMKYVLDLHCRPGEHDAIDKEIQHLLNPLDELVRQVPPTSD
jgi:hypothetical protein